MLLQKTILSIHVATIEVRVDNPTQSRLAGLARGQTYSDALAQQLANVAIGAERAAVQMRFKRDISLNRWIGVVRENLEQARKAGLISTDLEHQVGQGCHNGLRRSKTAATKRTTDWSTPSVRARSGLWLSRPEDRFLSTGQTVSRVPDES